MKELGDLLKKKKNWDCSASLNFKRLYFLNDKLSKKFAIIKIKIKTYSFIKCNYK